MKLHHLRNLVAIAQQGSIRGAARHLGTVQPTLTRSLSELERELGTPLFERHSKGMILTPLGQSFVTRATAILHDVRRAADEVEQLKGNMIGEVTVGLSIAAHLRLLPKALPPFRQRFPKVRLHVIEGFYPTLEAELKDGSVDFYVGPDPGLKLPSALRKEPLLTGDRAVLCRTGHPLAKSTSLNELVGAEWITTSITLKAENELGDLFKRYKLPRPALAMQSQSALTLLTCLANSDLVAMAPTQWVESPFANHIITTIPIREEITPASIIAVSRSDSPLSPAAGFFLDLMRRIAGREAPTSSKAIGKKLKTVARRR
jgi:LysR family transcriptional regulator, regulator of abg operon